MIAQPAKNPSQEVPMDAAMYAGKLDNGFTYYIRKLNSLEKTIEMRLVVNAGFYHEDDDQKELSHLVEHMAFNGTKHFPGTSLLAYFDKAGFRRAEDWGARTSVRNTLYQLSVQKPTSQLLDTCMLIMRDWAQNMLLDSLEIDNERGVVLAEMTRSRGEWSDLQYEVHSKILNHPKYPKDPGAAHFKNIKSFRQPSLTRFYKDWYRPDLQSIIIVGDVDVPLMEQKIRVLFGDLKMPDHPRPPITNDDIKRKYSVPLTGKNQYFLFERKFLNGVAIDMFLKRKSQQPNDDVYERLRTELFSQMLQSRLSRLRDRYNSPLETVGGSLSKNHLGAVAEIDAVLVQMSFINDLSIEAGFKAVVEELEQIKRFGFDEYSLATAKEALLSQHAVAVKPLPSAADIANRYAKYAAGLDDAPDPALEDGLVRDYVNRLSLEDMNDLAKVSINFEMNRDIVIKAASGYKSLPGGRVLDGWIKEVQSKDLKPHPQAFFEISQLITDTTGFDRPHYAYKIRELDETGTYVVRLPNAIKVYLRPFQPKGEESDKVLIYGFKPGGTLSYDSATRKAAAKAGSIIGHAGAGNYNKFQLEKYLSPKQVSVNTYLNDTLSLLSGSCDKQEIETLLQYIYLKLTAPRMDHEAFEDWKRRQKSDENAIGNCRNSFRKFMDEHSFAPNISNDVGKGEDNTLRDISLPLAYRIYKEQFAEFGGSTFIMTGDFNIENVVLLLCKYLGKLPQPADGNSQTVVAKNKLTPENPTITFQQKHKVFTCGNNGKAVVNIFFPGTLQPGLTTRLKLQLLAELLDTRIRARLREQEGGAYLPMTRINFMDNDLYCFSINYECASDKAEYLVAAATDEFKKMQSSGVDASAYQVALVKAQASLSREMYRNRFWLERLKEKALTNNDISEVLKAPTILVDILGIKDMNDAAKQYMDAANMESYIWLPERLRK